MNEHDYAILIGVQEYPHEKMSDLKGPVNDVLEFRKWLVDPLGGNMPSNIDRIRMINSPGGQGKGNVQYAKPNFEQIRDVLHEFVKKKEQIIDDSKVDDLKDFYKEVTTVNGVAYDQYYVGRRLYLYMSGHGISNSERVALMMANSNFGSLIGNNFPGTNFAKGFKDFAYFKEIVLIMDCCRDDQSGRSIFDSFPDAWRIPIELNAKIAKGVKFFYAYASHWGYQTKEKSYNGNLYLGCFTKVLLEGLRNAHNEAGEVTSSTLRDYVESQLPKEFSNEDVEEDISEIIFNKDILFSKSNIKNRTDYRVKISFSPKFYGRKIEITNQVGFKEEKEASQEGWYINLERGIYKVMDSESNDKIFIEIPTTLEYDLN